MNEKNYFIKEYKIFLKQKLNSIINFVNEHNTQTILGPSMINKGGYSLPVNAMTKDGQKQFIKALEGVLKLLEE